jgi:[protein-PII] uridylyltransferase
LEALAAKAGAIFPAPPSAGLICSADEIFNCAEVTAELAEILKRDGKASELRKDVVPLLMARRKAAMAQIATSFREQPRAARAMTRSYTWLTDCLVSCAFFCVHHPVLPIAEPHGSRTCRALCRWRLRAW